MTDSRWTARWASLFAFVVLATVATGITLVQQAAPADAWCLHEGASATTTWSGHGTETSQWSSTCDDDGNYYGKYKDSTTPNNSCMYIKYYDDLVWKFTSQNCNSTYKNYNYFDSNHISTTYICDAYGCSNYMGHKEF